MLKLILMHSTEVGLVLFLASFVFITWYALTRSRSELDGWSKLPLGNPNSQTDENQPTQPERCR